MASLSVFVADPPCIRLSRARVCADLEICRRDGTWRHRAVGQGCDDPSAGLARDFGVDVA